MTARTEPEPAPFPATAELASATARRYSEAALAGRGEEAERIALDCLVGGMAVTQLYEQVITPAMALIGELWDAGAMTIADEHLASALNMKVMAAVYGMALAARPVPEPGRVLLAGVEGDRHGVGIRMAGDVLDLAGFEVIYLGENVPTDQIVRSADINRPDLVAIAVPTPATAGAATVAVAAVRRRFGELPILIGGPGAGTTTTGDGVVTTLTLEDLTEQALAITAGIERKVDRPPPSIQLEDATWRRRRDDEASPEDRFLEIAVDAAEAVRENARTAEAYRRLAYQDPLTGVANRRAFEERVASRIRAGRPGAIVMVDLDHFKLVNDQLGHLAGDRVLRAVASLLEATAKSEDFVARLGGDEFALLLDSDSIPAGRRQAERFLAALREEARAGAITATCGISRLDGDRRHTLIQADLALYRGKASGGDRVELSSSD
jgi:diguanylate cyclase (GGDEF)-like protein